MSAGNLGRGVFEFGGDDKEFQAVADRVEKNVSRIGERMNTAAASVNLFDKALRLGAATTFANALKRVSETADEVFLKFRTGKASIGDVVEEIARSIPIIGGFVAAGRTLREVFTQEKAGLEILKEQTTFQQKRLELVRQEITAIRELGREREKAQAQIDKLSGRSPVVLEGEEIVRKTRIEREDAKKKLAEQTALLNDFRSQQSKVAQELTTAKTEGSGQLTVRPGKSKDLESRIEESVVDPGVADLEARQRFLDTQTRQLASDIAQTVAIMNKATDAAGLAKLGDFVASSLAKVARGVEGAKEQIKAGHLEMSTASKHAIDSMKSDLDRYSERLAALRSELEKGLIDPKQFDVLFKRQTIDTAIDLIQNTIKDKVSRFAPAILQNINFAPLINTFDAAKRNLEGIFGGRGGGRNQQPEFRARTVSLEGLGAGIQEAAASRVGSIQEKNLEQAKALVDLTKKGLTLLTSINKRFEKPPYAVAKG